MSGGCTHGEQLDALGTHPRDASLHACAHLACAHPADRSPDTLVDDAGRFYKPFQARAAMRLCLQGCMLMCVAWMRACVRACVLACVRVCMRACVHACVHGCVRACVHACVHALVFCIVPMEPHIHNCNTYTGRTQRTRGRILPGRVAWRPFALRPSASTYKRGAA